MIGKVYHTKNVFALGVTRARRKSLTAAFFRGLLPVPQNTEKEREILIFY